MEKITNIIKGVILGVMVLMLPVNASGALEQVQDELLDEPIFDGYISATQLRKGEVLRYSFRVQTKHLKMTLYSELEGLDKTMRVIWMSENGQTLVEDFDGDKSLYNGELEISEGMEEGKWRISKIQFLSGKVYGDMIPKEVVSVSQEAGSADIQDDLSFSEFTVQGTKADRKAPSIRKKSMGLTKKVVKKKGKTKFYVKANDKSPMRYVVCGWRNSATKEVKYGEMTYNKKKTRYEYTVFGIDVGKKGKLRLIRVEACDRYGNKTVLKKNFPKIILSRK